MSWLRHQMILASAGSGKTYALTSRFIGLLARGANPERIVALTFTRKAAGEFFDEILKKLAKAAASAAEAEKLAAEFGLPALRREDFRRMLRDVTAAMPRLRLETLDGFMGGIARAFALELGLTGDFELLEEYGVDVARRRVLQRMFARRGGLTEAQKDFIEAFKRATFGSENKRLGAVLEDFIKSNQQTFLAVPEKEKWGWAEVIWPRGNPWLAPVPDTAEVAQQLRQELAKVTWSDSQRELWAKVTTEFEQWAPGVPIGERLKKFLEKVLAAWPEVEAGRVELMLARKKVVIGAGLGCALGLLARRIMSGELRRRLEVTRGIYAVLAGYEEYYHLMIRRTGQLTFGDIQRLLMPEAGGPLLTREAGGEGRLFIDYRLDAEIDHWLLDEFQDTSRGQWSVLQNLVDEVVQDAEGSRSFFCVGDVKQAIYGWREGDPRLFREILERYNATEKTVELTHLTESWRSSPALIEMLNEVFGAAQVWSELFPGEMSVRWNREWKNHTSAWNGRAGHAAWLHAEDEEDCWRQTLKILNTIRPWERGLSCAVLVRKNEIAAELADYLRREGQVPAVAEADLHIVTDNPLGAGLLALMQAAAYPGDLLAGELWRSGPLGAIAQAAGWETAEQVSRTVLGQVVKEGFARTLETWGGELEKAGVLAEDFSRLRLRQILAAAERFDVTGNRNVGDFCAYMERQTVRDGEGTNVIRIMTVHKAKGLGFDLVVLPELGGKKLDVSRSKSVSVQQESGERVSWVLNLPSRMLAEADEVLRAHVQQELADEGYEGINLFYVAMTRAKYGMYLIGEQPSDSTSRNFPKVLSETLGDGSTEIWIGEGRYRAGWSRGSGDWFNSFQVKSPACQVWGGLLGVCHSGKRSLRLQPRLPASDIAYEGVRARMFFLEESRGLWFGTAVHALLAKIEWLDGLDVEAWSKQLVDPVEVCREVIECLRDENIAPIWIKPKEVFAVDLWRERAFEMVMEGAWVSGVIDRVHVYRDDKGRVLGATIYDYKTDRVDPDYMVSVVANYSPQLRLYQLAVARLLGLNLESVRCELVFTGLKRRVGMPVRLV